MLKVSTKGLKKLSKFPTVFNNSNLERKHLLVGSMFPQKFQFEENKVRTEDINPILLKITSINRKLQGNKKRTNQNYLICPMKYSRRESNPHVLRHWILNPTCLPIPPLEQIRTAKIKNIFRQPIKNSGFYNFLK